MRRRRCPGHRSIKMYKNILIVDSEANISACLGFLLAHSGFNVQTACSFREALDSVETCQPDLVLLDTALPDRSGYELCQALLAMPHCSHLPVLMLTTQELAMERQKAISLGAMDFIVKPFNPTEVLGRVQELVREAA